MPALLIREQSIYTTGRPEPVLVDYVGCHADYTSLAVLQRPQVMPLYVNHHSCAGDRWQLGSFTDNEELVFVLYVFNTKKTYFSGAAARNADQTVHAQLTDLGLGRIRVGFEDLWGGGDRDYNDLVFDVIGFTPPPDPDPDPEDPDDPDPVVPEPATLGLVALGAGLMALRRRRR